MTPNIVFIGCGKMGQALLQSLLTRPIDPSRICVIDPHHQSFLANHFPVAVFSAPQDLAPHYRDAIFLCCVKPQILCEVLPFYGQFCSSRSLFISIAAGKPLAFYEQYFAKNQAIIRAMPNLPAIIGAGVTVACANSHTNAQFQHHTREIFTASGQLLWVEEEHQLDAVTAISGSGPAYLFYLAEVMEIIARDMGLDDALASTLIRSTLAGSAALLQTSGKKASVLRTEVTSPGGTTAAALEILMQDDRLQLLFKQAIHAAQKRSIALRSAS